MEEDRDVAAQVRPALELLQCRQHDLVGRRVLAADVDEDAVRLDRVRGDQAALEEPVRDAHHDLVVLEAAGLGFVGIDDHVVRVRVLIGLRDEGPLAAGREERPAAAAQLGGDHLGGHCLRRHCAGFLQRAVAADRLVLGELRQVALVGSGEDDLSRHV